MHTVVILHGWGQNKTFWAGAFTGVSDVSIIIFDLPGFGAEPLPRDGADWGIPHYAAWVREKIEKEKLDGVVLLGHSFGGRIAAHLAGERPSWLAALILYGAPCVYRPSFSVRIKKKIARLAKVFSKFFGRMSGLSGGYRGNPELTEAEHGGRGGIFRRVVGYDQAEALKKITVPTLIIWGEKDAVVPLRIAHEMSRLVSGSRLEVLPGLGHNAHIENPNLFYGVAKKFIENF